jgi:hypothetical protein
VPPFLFFNVHTHVMILTLGSRPRQRHGKVQGQECNLGITFTFPGMQKNVREWAHALPSGLPLWELKSLWNLKFSESNLRRQNSLDWKLPYTIGNLLRRSLKWAHMIHLSTDNTSYGQKKGRESKCPFDSQPLNVNNLSELCAWRWHATYLWKYLDKGYNFALDLVSIEGLHNKLWASKMAGILISRISKLPTWESWKKWHLGVAPTTNHKEYYKGEGGGFFWVQAVVSLVNQYMHVVHPCTKSVPTMH